MGDEKKGGKKGGGFGATAVKLLILLALLGVMFEIASRYTGNSDLSPLIQLQRALKR